jgi:hypothetical protein
MQVTGLDRMTYVRARLETLGTNMIAHGGDDAGYAEAPRMGSVARLAFSILDCRILSEEIWMGHNAVENMADQIVVGCMGSSVAASQRVRLIDVLVVADNGHVEVAVQGEWTEVGLWVNEIGNPSVVVQRLAVCPTARAELVGVIVCEDNLGSPAARSAEAFEFRSYLKLDEIEPTRGATAAEEEVVGTCVYYYLSGAGHDARSRIGRVTVFLCPVRRLSHRLGASGRRAVSDSTSGM